MTFTHATTIQIYHLNMWFTTFHFSVIFDVFACLFLLTTAYCGIFPYSYISMPIKYEKLHVQIKHLYSVC